MTSMAESMPINPVMLDAVIQLKHREFALKAKELEERQDQLKWKDVIKTRTTHERVGS